MTSASKETGIGWIGRVPLSQPATALDESPWVKAERYNLGIDSDLLPFYQLEPTASTTGKMGRPPSFRRIFTLSKDSVTELEYPQTMADIFTLHKETMRVVEGLQTQVNALAQFVAALSEGRVEQSDTGAADVEIGAISAIDRLNHASDIGEVDEQTLAIANELMSSDDRLGRIAAIRAIAVADPKRGLELATAALETEENSIFRSVLRSVQRSVG